MAIVEQAISGDFNHLIVFEFIHRHYEGDVPSLFEVSLDMNLSHNALWEVGGVSCTRKMVSVGEERAKVVTLLIDILAAIRSHCNHVGESIRPFQMGL